MGFLRIKIPIAAVDGDFRMQPGTAKIKGRASETELQILQYGFYQVCFVYTFIYFYLSIYMYIYLFIYLLIYLFIYLYLFIHLFIHSFIYSFIYLFFAVDYDLKCFYSSVILIESCWTNLRAMYSYIDFLYA